MKEECVKASKENVYQGSFFVSDKEWHEKTKDFSKGVKELLDKIRGQVKSVKSMAS